MEINNQPWFVGKNAADMLEYTNSRKALRDHVDVEDMNTVTIHYEISGNHNQIPQTIN